MNGESGVDDSLLVLLVEVLAPPAAVDGEPCAEIVVVDRLLELVGEAGEGATQLRVVAAGLRPPAEHLPGRAARTLVPARHVPKRRDLRDAYIQFAGGTCQPP